jgi:hypothetical protein
MLEEPMDNEQRNAKLADVFLRLGANDPKGWAASEIEEGIPQLATFLFLKTAWRYVVSEIDTTWIETAIETSSRRPTDPCAGIGPALQRLVDSGVNQQDITDIVRVKQYELLFRLCYLLGYGSDFENEPEDVGWILCETDKNGELSGRTIGGLHESVLGMDPTGREMRPRP